MRLHGPRAGVSRSTIFEVTVDRERAAFSSWYELFPRSAANDAQRHGTFADVICRIPYVRDMGFDVLYFPPLHPIGRTNRKGRNNALRAEIGDPGSVYAIGSAEGGHDAIHPELGTIEDFRRLVREANANGVEIAMDIAWQCSPDHPWLNEHPEWFERRPDGLSSMRRTRRRSTKTSSIFDLMAMLIQMSGSRFAMLSCSGLAGRANFPHRQSAYEAAAVLGMDDRRGLPRVSRYHLPAEAFTRPKMMKRLAKVGFQQSYTYFTWRNSKQEITEYITN